MNRYIRDGDNPDLTEERRKAAFDTEELGALIWDGAQNLRRRREINAFLESRPELQDAKPLTFMSREEMLENESRKVSAHGGWKEARLLITVLFKYTMPVSCQRICQLGIRSHHPLYAGQARPVVVFYQCDIRTSILSRSLRKATF